MLGPEKGLIKYIIKTPLTVVGFISMYIHGGLWLSLYQGLTHLDEGLISAFFHYLVTEYLPPTSVGDVVFQVAVGAGMAGLSWYTTQR